MARTAEEWGGLLGSALSKMALVRGTDSPDAYLPEDCFRVISETFAVAMREARAEGFQAASVELAATPARDAANSSVIRLAIRAFPLVRNSA